MTAGDVAGAGLRMVDVPVLPGSRLLRRGTRSAQVRIVSVTGEAA